MIPQRASRELWEQIRTCVSYTFWDLNGSSEAERVLADEDDEWR